MTDTDEYSRRALSVPFVAILSFSVLRMTILIAFIKRSYVIGEGGFTSFVSPDCFSSENMASCEFCARDRKPESNFLTHLGL